MWDVPVFSNNHPTLHRLRHLCLCRKSWVRGGSNRRVSVGSNGWMDGQRDGWRDGWVDGWVYGWVDGWVYGWVDGGRDERVVVGEWGRYGNTHTT